MMRSSVFIILCSLSLTCSSTSTYARADLPPSGSQAKQVPTIEQWLGLRYAAAPQISPDGHYVAHQTTEGSFEENMFVSRIEVVQVATGARRLLTDFKGLSYGPRWMPDGKTILFLSTRDGRPQLFMIPVEGGAPLPLTRVETGVGSFEISPDGRSVAFTSTDPEPASLKERREKVGDFQIIGEPPASRTHLWMLRLTGNGSQTAEPERLTSGNQWTVNSFSWSPDGNRIAFSASNPLENYGSYKGPDAAFWQRDDIYLLRLADKSVKKIVSSEGFDFNPVWSPDGREIAYMTSNNGQGGGLVFAAIWYLAVVPAEGGASRLLTGNFDESPGLIGWSTDGIYFSALQKTYSHLFRLNPQTGAIERLSKPAEGIYSQFSFTKDFKQTAYLSDAGDRLPEVYLSQTSTFEQRRVTTLNDQLKNFVHSTREVVAWKSTDGTPVEGVLVKPENFDPSKKYPLLVVIHTGPSVVDQPSLNPFNDIYPVEPLVAKGALVLMANYRGSIGYGQKFRLLLARQLGLPQYSDIISGVDHLIARGMVDGGRMGAMGYSHGGYIAGFIAAYSDRFKAVSVGAGVSDWRIFYTTSDAGPGMLGLLKATPWDDAAYYKEIAPLSYVKRARTPTLIQHGEFDMRAPITGSYELYRALKDQGVQVKMIVYKNAGHAGRSWTLKQFRALKQHNYEWFSQLIWGENP